jgi:carbamoyltransferase
MLIAGVNMGLTREGRPLKDGGACLLSDGRIVVAIAEERLTHQKHAGGFAHSLQYCLSSAGVALSDLDMIVVSSCAEEQLEDGYDIGLPIDRTKIRSVPSHHLSHAYAAFLTSPFEEAVIMVFDNEGTMIAGQQDPIYWANRVERNSYYIGKGKTIEPLEEADDGLADDELGPGEAYRHFTYFLGWHSYVYAGNTMGLAPYGRRDAFGGLRVFDLHSGQIHSLMSNGREDPARALIELGRAKGLHLGPARSPEDPITPRHSDLAAVIQDELERALIYKAKALHDLTGVKNLCLGGGIALNCVANRKILDNTPFEQLYVCPAPGDSGQCLGNAMYGWTHLAGQARQLPPLSPYLGRVYLNSELESAIVDLGHRLSYVRSSELAEDAARLISEGHVIGWFQGSSELGPRALGARSILADPRQPAMRDYLNLVVKRREVFRPYAPSVLQSEVERFFDLPHRSSYMELTGTVNPAMRHRIPAVTHVDGSSRPQTVADNDNEPFVQMIRAFWRLTDLPLVLNTSFNLAGEPIVESPKDAIACFLRSELDALVMGEFIVRRTDSSLDPRFLKWASPTQVVLST